MSIIHFIKIIYSKIPFTNCIKRRTVGQKKGGGRGNSPIISNANYRGEMKFIPISMDYCLFQFDAVQFFLGVRLHGGSLPNFNFFNVNPQI